MKKCGLFSLILIASVSLVRAQPFRTGAQRLVMTNEDSLQAGSNTQKTVISGYGSVLYQRNFDAQLSTATLERAVLFVGHQFNNKIAFFSELEFENAKVAAGSTGSGEIAMEQAFLKFNLTPGRYIIAGLFVPRIGILNENHLPVNFNGVERPLVEQFVIPATWRELGVGFYGSSSRLPINYSVALLNGLNSASFEHGTGIREGRAEGSTALANNLALTASLQYAFSDFRFQVSGYMGGTVGLSRRGSDSLGINSGAFGTPVYLGEANLQYSHNAFSAKAIAAYISYPEAGKINTVYGKNLATGMYGAYLEVAYDLLYERHRTPQLIPFARFEIMDLNARQDAVDKIYYDGTEKSTQLILGAGYFPLPNVVIKADVRLSHTGKQNPALVINPPPNALPYNQANQFANLGIGYSF